jgi:hypothetical protein
VRTCARYVGNITFYFIFSSKWDSRLKESNISNIHEVQTLYQQYTSTINASLQTFVFTCSVMHRASEIPRKQLHSALLQKSNRTAELKHFSHYSLKPTTETHTSRTDNSDPTFENTTSK